MSKSMVRSVKNVTKGYSSVQVKVRNATSNDAWGPSGTDMGEIAQMTYNNSGDFYEIMDMLDKRMNDKGKNWRHVLKSLKVLDYCLHEGSELVVTWARKNIFIIKTLREFQYIDEEGRDVGQNVRVSAKELTSLILDEERLRAERHDRKLWKQRVTGLDDGYGPTSPQRPPRERRERRNNNDDDDLEFKLALEASKNEHDEAERRRGAPSKQPEDDDDLAKAIKLSKEEEDLRRRELENQNAQNLFDFDNTPSQPAQQPQATGWNQGYQQQGAVDWFGNPIAQQQIPQNTSYLNNAYAQPTGMQQPQQTGFQNGSGYAQFQQQQPQQPAFDPSAYQQQLQAQQTALNMNNPYSSQNPAFGAQQQQQQPDQQNMLHAGSNNPWGSNQSSLDSMKPMPTGSNNPFASSVNRPQTSSAAQRPPTLSTLQEQQQQNTFNQFNSLSLGSQSINSQPTARPSTSAQPQDPYKANLNQLLSSGEGQDTFGNTGDLRIPAQHTAPGTFVNSAGQGLNKMNASQTGSNPFMHSQFTGMPQAQYPAQTGPASGFGSSPFGQSNPYGQRQNQQQGSNLIDF